MRSWESRARWAVVTNRTGICCGPSGLASRADSGRTWQSEVLPSGAF